MIKRIKSIFGKTPKVTKKQYTGIEVYGLHTRIYANYQVTDMEITESKDGKILIIKAK